MKFIFVSLTGREANAEEIQAAAAAGVQLESWDVGYADPKYLARRYDGAVAGYGEYADECKAAGLKLGFFEREDWAFGPITGFRVA